MSAHTRKPAPAPPTPAELRASARVSVARARAVRTEAAHAADRLAALLGTNRSTT
ncbi:hypothetical protein [Streptomyces triticirhizae]|uniref:hypothetical protein n=1 Tax=Streptomyces triticirhizae TaxID=2483353 RepID=UPI0013155767|nr:hypothetical protein [Streptomyces triticirhizae]